MLAAREGEAASWSTAQRMRFELLRAKAMNKGDILFTSDSVMRQVTDYYDSHGTDNERMEAHYLLGCVYRGLYEVPRAIDCFMDGCFFEILSDKNVA